MDFPLHDETGNTLVLEGRRLFQGNGMSPRDVQAFHYFLEAALAGDAEAQFLVAQCYAHGYGVVKDETAVNEWLLAWGDWGASVLRTNVFGTYKNANGDGVLLEYSAAALWGLRTPEHGIDVTQSNLGLCYELNRKTLGARSGSTIMAQLSEERWHPDMQAYIGYCCHTGLGAPQDLRKAVEYYRRAARYGNALAIYNLAVCLFEGQGVEQDYGKAVRFFEAVAREGRSQLVTKHAQHNTALCYWEGRGVRNDVVQAYKWFRIAGWNPNSSMNDAATSHLLERMSPSEIEAGEESVRCFCPGDIKPLL
jgi:TPR repeat protein